jgi:hypothetical protein
MIRDYRPEDFEAVKALHEGSYIDYNMPDLNHALFLVKKVQEVDGKVVAAMALRIEAETYLWCGGGPREKMAAMCELQPAVLLEAWMSGIDNVVAWIPQSVEKKFKKRLMQLGWERDRDGWHSWSRPTEQRERVAA